MSVPATTAAEQVGRHDLAVLRCAHEAAAGTGRADYEEVVALLVYRGLSLAEAEQAVADTVAIGLLRDLQISEG
jgi:hypothetical protein